MKINTPYKCVKLPTVVYFQEGPGLRNWQYGISGIPFLNIRTLKDDGFIDKSVCQFVKEEEFKNKYEHFLLDEGDFVVSSSGTLGKLAEVRKEDLPVMLNTSVIRFRSLDSSILDKSFLKWFIKSPLYFRQIEKASTGTAIKNYGPSHLKQVLIPLPPIAEQRRIAAILDKADSIRRKRQEAIRLTEELGRSLFLDMFGDPVSNPKGWKIQKLKDVIKSIDAGWSANGEEKKCEADEWGVLKVSAVTSGKFKPFEHKSIGKNPQFKKDPIVPKKGDLLFSRANTRELVAATCIVEKDYQNIFLPDKLWKISTNENQITPEYLKFLLTYQRYRDILTSQATGTSGSMLNISQGKLLNMDAPIPNINIQRKFSDFIWKSIDLSTTVESHYQESENLFNSLLQRAFRGEL